MTTTTAALVGNRRAELDAGGIHALALSVPPFPPDHTHRPDVLYFFPLFSWSSISSIILFLIYLDVEGVCFFSISLILDCTGDERNDIVGLKRDEY